MSVYRNGAHSSGELSIDVQDCFETGAANLSYNITAVVVVLVKTPEYRLRISVPRNIYARSFLLAESGNSWSLVREARPVVPKATIVLNTDS